MYNRSIDTQEMILDALTNKGLTQQELEEVCGVSSDTVRKNLKYFRRKKIIYICDWQHLKSGRQRAVYKFGENKKDAPAPEVEKIKRKKKQYKRRDTDAEVKTRPAWTNAPASRDPLVSWLFGDSRKNAMP